MITKRIELACVLYEDGTSEIFAMGWGGTVKQHREMIEDMIEGSDPHVAYRWGYATVTMRLPDVDEEESYPTVREDSEGGDS